MSDDNPCGHGPEWVSPEEVRLIDELMGDNRLCSHVEVGVDDAIQSKCDLPAVIKTGLICGHQTLYYCALHESIPTELGGETRVKCTQWVGPVERYEDLGCGLAGRFDVVGFIERLELV